MANEEHSGGSTGGKDYFGTFLETVQNETRTTPSAEQRAAEDQVQPLRILAVLRDHGPQSIPEAQAAAGLDFESFADALRTFRQAGLVEIQGMPGRETLELTDTGGALAGASTS